MDVFLSSVAEAVAGCHANTLASLLNVTQPGADVAVGATVDVKRVDGMAAAVLPEGYDSVAAGHLKVVAAVRAGRRVEAWHQQHDLFEAFLPLVRDLTDNWLLPALYAVAVDARVLAAGAEEEVIRSGIGLQHKALEALTITLQKAYKFCLSHRQPDTALSKKWGALFMSNQLFKVYFKMNNLRGCTPLMKAVHSRSFYPLKLFPLSQTVTFHYYRGRLAMFEDNYAEANEALTFALMNCSRAPQHARNVRRIVQSLVPVRMHLGILPRPGLLHRHRLPHFLPLCAAIRMGNVRQFRDALTTHRATFIRCGLYLILEKLEPLVYRSLFKHVCATINTGNNIFSLPTLQRALAWAGYDADIDELECLLANLKFKGLLKGYLSHTQAKLVTGKDPFPKVFSVADKWSEVPSLT